jgi:hypothetical protein
VEFEPRKIAAWMARNWLINAVGGLFVLPGALMLIGGIVVGVWTMAFNQLAFRAQGTVIANRHWVYDDGEEYRPEVEFETPDGRRHRFVGNIGSTTESFKVGELVPVVYAGSNPDSGASIGRLLYQYYAAMWISGMGMCWLLPTGIPRYFEVKRAKLTDWLKVNGRAIQADFTGARLIGRYEADEPNLYDLTAQWKNPDTNEVQVFRQSENLRVDPTPYLAAAKNITVRIDPNNPGRYWMDTTFLPKLTR